MCLPILQSLVTRQVTTQQDDDVNTVLVALYYNFILHNLSGTPLMWVIKNLMVQENLTHQYRLWWYRINWGRGKIPYGCLITIWIRVNWLTINWFSITNSLKCRESEFYWQLFSHLRVIVNFFWVFDYIWKKIWNCRRHLHFNNSFKMSMWFQYHQQSKY